MAHLGIWVVAALTNPKTDAPEQGYILGFSQAMERCWEGVGISWSRVLVRCWGDGT